MKLTYKRKISKNEKWATGACLSVMIVSIYFSHNPIIGGSFCLLYSIIYIYFFYIKPVAKITEKNVLVLPAHFVDIHRIFSLEEGGKKGLKIRYYLNDMERATFIPLTDEDRPRLIEDLLKINPCIEVK